MAGIGQEYLDCVRLGHLNINTLFICSVFDPPHWVCGVYLPNNAIQYIAHNKLLRQNKTLRYKQILSI